MALRVFDNLAALLLSGLWPAELLRTFEEFGSWPIHIGLKRKIQRLLKVNFVHRNFIRLDLQKVRQSRATNRVSGAATIKSFQFTSTLATQSHPKFSKEHPNWKFWACVKWRKSRKKWEFGVAIPFRSETTPFHIRLHGVERSSGVELE